MLQFCNEIGLGLVSEAVVGHLENVQDYIVYHQFYLLALFGARVPDQVDFTLENVFFVEQKLDEVRRPLDKLQVSVLAEDVLHDFEPAHDLNEILDGHELVEVLEAVGQANGLDGLVDALYALDSLLEVGEREEGRSYL